jgi:hypothetical protein
MVQFLSLSESSRDIERPDAERDAEVLAATAPGQAG